MKQSIEPWRALALAISALDMVASPTESTTELLNKTLICIHHDRIVAALTEIQDLYLEVS